MMICTTNGLVSDHSERALGFFPGQESTLISKNLFDPLRLTEGSAKHPQHSYVVPSMTYRFCPTGDTAHHPQLNIGAPIMVIGNVLHPHVVNRIMFVLNSHTRWWLCVAQIDRDGRGGTTYSLHRIKFQF